MSDTPVYAVKVRDGRIITGLSWTNASEQVRLYGAEWVNNYEDVLEHAQAEAKANSNTSGNTRKLTPAEEAVMNAPDMYAAAQAAVATVAEAGSSELADMTREELFEIATKMGLKIDKRTGHAKLADIIDKARAEQAEVPAEETPAEVVETAESAPESTEE